ncbi:MAG TPA: hypothetical protein VIU15_27085 [Streptomyces sp.]
MRAASASRGSRSAHRAGAVLLFALIALVHVLCCAHGPTSTESSRKDSLVMTESCDVHGADHPSHGAQEHCEDSDAPAVHPSRDHDPTGAVAPATASGALHQATASLPRLSGTPPPPLPPGNDRARLGVWRT